MTPSNERTSRSFIYGPRRPEKLYQTLFNVTFRHNYYNNVQGLYPDFCVTPTPTSASLMTSLGMLFRNDGTGFSVLMQPSGLDQVTRYIRYQGLKISGQTQYWTRLTFLLTMISPLFVGITDLPIATKPSQHLLYACNTVAHLENGTIVLAKRNYLDGTARYPVTGSDLEVIVPADTVAVVVKDISGTVVIPTSGSKSSAQIPLYSVDDAKTASIDLGSLPYDLYTIAVQTSATARLVTRMFRTAKRAEVGDDTLSENELVAPRYPWRAAFVPSASAPMVMLDILLTNPTPDAPGLFPLTSLFAASGPANFSSDSSYVLPFDARATYWEYYIVSRDPAAHLTDLRIESLTRDDVKFRQVSNPKPLPNGAIPIVMRSTNKLPLRQLPPQRFRLTARRTGPAGQSNDIVVNPLPVAPGAPVWPGPKAQSRSGTSEMFVYV